MHQTQIQTYGIDGVLAERLRELAQAKRFWLQAKRPKWRRVAVCCNPRRRPTIFVIVLGRDLERELTLLEEVHACLPGTATIAGGEADNPRLAGLAWEMGATFAVFPPMPVERISDLNVTVLQEPTP